MLLGKSFDSFAPTGPPWSRPTRLRTGKLKIQCRLNGSDAGLGTNILIFPVAELIVRVQVQR